MDRVICWHCHAVGLIDDVHCRVCNNTGMLTVYEDGEKKPEPKILRKRNEQPKWLKNAIEIIERMKVKK